MRETVLPHSGKPTPPRFARLPLPEEGARVIFKKTLITSLSFTIRDSRSPTYAALFRFPHLSFMPPVPYPPLRGTFPSRGRLTIRAYRPLTCSEAATLRAVPFPRIVIPSEVEGSLLHCRHMHACALTQTTPWCFPLFSLTHVLPVCKKDFSASALMARKKDDSLTSSFIPLRRVVPLRGTLSCAFVAARLQGPTRIIGVTCD